MGHEGTQGELWPNSVINSPRTQANHLTAWSQNTLNLYSNFLPSCYHYLEALAKKPLVFLSLLFEEVGQFSGANSQWILQSSLRVKKINQSFCTEFILPSGILFPVWTCCMAQDVILHSQILQPNVANNECPQSQTFRRGIGDHFSWGKVFIKKMHLI